MDNFKSKPRRYWMYPLFGLAFVLVGSLVVMLLWNAIIPDVIPGVHALRYIQAMGLLVLSKILFGGFRGGPPHRKFGGWGNYEGSPVREKWMNMSEEEREKFKSEWRNRCGRRF